MQPSKPGLLIGQGRTADIYAWQEGRILKLFHTGFPREAAKAELSKSRLISGMNLPTPKFIETVEIEGRMGLVYERVEGISMLKMINARPWMGRSLARKMAELHTIIHQQDGTGFPSIHPELMGAIQEAITLHKGFSNKVMKSLQDLPGGNALCHFDFHPDQIMVTPQGLVILDWMTCKQGHPLADVARTTLLIKIGQVPYAGRVMKRLINLWRGLFLRSYMRCYFELNPGMKREAVTPWLIPVAVARMKERIEGEMDALLGIIDDSARQLENQA